MNVKLEKSDKKGKRYKVEVDGKTVHFGSSEHENFLIHGDEARKRMYILRHEKREDWKDPKTAGFWSRWLTWNKPTLKGSKDDIKKRFSINIK